MGLTDEELNSKLLDMAKDRGLKSVYCVQTLGGEMTPRLLYRVDPDGKRELVRGAVLDDLDQRALRSGVEAAGKDLWVANYATCRRRCWRRRCSSRCDGEARQREEREAAVLSAAGLRSLPILVSS